MTFPDMPTIIVDVGFTEGASTQNYWHIGDEVRGRIGTFALAPNQLFVDVTSYVRHISLTAGTSSRITQPLVEYEAGTATFIFDNSTRVFDPLNINSPFYVPAHTEIVNV